VEAVMKAITERDYYTVAEAAQRLNVSHSTVWRWVRSGKLPAYRVGSRNIRIKQSELDKMVEEVHAEPDWKNMTFEERRRYLLRPPTEEELRRRRDAFERTQRNRKHRSIAPMTSDELVRLSRDKDFWYGPDH
jgi:excisionase family DNA binding protein